MISSLIHIYIAADAAAFSFLLISLYFAAFSRMPVLDVRKTQYRKNLALFFLHMGIWIKAVLWIYWYFLLESLVIAVSSNRCILCILDRAGSISWILGVLKIMSFPVILYCLELGFIDKDIKARPFVNNRVNSVLIAAPFLLFEIAADVIMQRKILSIISGGTLKAFKLHLGASWCKLANNDIFWTSLFFAFVLILLAGLLMLLKFSKEDEYYFNLRKIFITQISVAFFSVVMIFSVLIAMHNELCPLFLDIDNHYCIFCILQLSFDLPASLFMLLLGFGLSCSLGFMPYMKNENGAGITRNKPIFIDKYQGIVKTSFVLICAGTVIILIRLAVSLIGG